MAPQAQSIMHPAKGGETAFGFISSHGDQTNTIVERIFKSENLLNEALSQLYNAPPESTVLGFQQPWFLLMWGHYSTSGNLVLRCATKENCTYKYK